MNPQSTRTSLTPNTLVQPNNNPSWNAIFERYNIAKHDFDSGPFDISAKEIRVACTRFERTREREAWALCKQDSRESCPQVFCERGLFVLPVQNGRYAIVKGEGYVDVPPIESGCQEYRSDLPFELETAGLGNSAIQHLDHAYALGLIRHFVNDDSLVLTVRDRTYRPSFSFVVGGSRISVRGVQTKVLSGYEGANQIVLIVAKGNKANNNVIRQLYYPFRQWQQHTAKPVSTLFFQRYRNEYRLWHFGFDDPNDYNSIRLLNSARYRITRTGE